MTATLTDRALRLGVRNTARRVSGVLVSAASLGYVSWLVVTVNTAALWLAIPFVAANLFLVVLLAVTVVNNWSRSTMDVPAPDAAPRGLVAVLIPTYGEPPSMLAATLCSILDQDWPADQIVVVVGDDAANPAIRAVVDETGLRYPGVPLYYHRPPRHGSVERRGDAKDGNLNSMFDMVTTRHPDVEYIETRDADDLVGDELFLRHTVGLLHRQPDTAYVQTIKDARVSPSDPFGNRRRFFYRGIMLSRDAAGAAFPCGSGLVWRRVHVEGIGGFPTWNVVEDLYSGIVALRHGLRGAYIPILGAVAQVAPEDIPNVYQQLGTWAVDTLRIMFWRFPGRTTALSLRQRLHFAEMGLFYLSSIPTLALCLAPALCLLTGTRVVAADPIHHAIFAIVYTNLIAWFTFMLGNGTPMRELWRARQVWIGMMVVYAYACCVAVIYGRHRKPRYRVTRKYRQEGVYLVHVAPQIGLLALLAVALVAHLVGRASDLSTSDFGSMFWAVFYATALAGFVRRAWYRPSGAR